MSIQNTAKSIYIVSYGLLPGQGQGFDIDLIKLISDAVSIPVIASSGAGSAEHFSEVFSKTNASAALAAGIFHRKEVKITLKHALPHWFRLFPLI